MSRAAAKPELIEAANGQFEKMWSLINAMTQDEQSAAFNFGEDSKRKEAHWGRDKNLRDVLIHLYEWHQLLLNWVRTNRSGEAVPFLPAPYNWKTYSQMNAGFWEKHQNTAYRDSITMLKESHACVLKLIDEFSNAELFEKTHFPWTGSTTLGSYCVSATSSHYDWAIRKIKLHIKTCGSAAQS